LVRIIGDAAFVPLMRRAIHEPRRYVLVDLDDYERVTRSKWRAEKSGLSFYAYATALKYLPEHHQRMHAYVLRLAKGEIGDHISGDTLDNRSQNLRCCSVGDNAKNHRRMTFQGKTSRFKGVSWSRRDERWLALITSNGTRHYLGLFDTEEDAARAYDVAAAQEHGAFARTNQVMKLFEMDDPFVPNCTKADVYDRLVDHASLSGHIHRLEHVGYEQRLTDRLRLEIAAL
jgi:hypothetical protein